MHIMKEIRTENYSNASKHASLINTDTFTGNCISMSHSCMFADVNTFLKITVENNIFVSNQV